MIHKLFHIRCLWTCLFMVLSCTIDAQELITNSFPFARKLFTNEVYHVHQDSQGYLWFGTTSSLHRWDGHRLQTFRSDGNRPHLMPDNSVRKIADTSSFLWIVTRKGLVLYDKSDGHFFQPADQRITGRWIDGIHADNNGGIWLAVNKQLFHCDAECQNIDVFDPFAGMPSSHDITDIFIDRQDYIWVMCSDGVLLRGREGVFKQLPAIPNSGAACTMYQDTNGRFWIGTWGKGLWQCYPDGDGPDGNMWQEHKVKNFDTGSYEGIFFCICQDKSKGWLWILSYNKLYVLSYANGQLQPVDVSSHVSPHHYYTSMTCDREGNMWLTAYDGGYMVSFNDSGIQNYCMPVMSDNNEELLNLFADKEYVWINRQRHGLQLMNRRGGKITDVSLALPDIAIMRKTNVPNAVWVAQKYYSTAYRLERKGTNVSCCDTVDIEKILDNSRPIKNIVEVPSGTLWLLTQHHLVARLSDSDDLFTADLHKPTAIAHYGQGGEVLCAANGQLMSCTVKERRIACRPVSSFDFLHDGESVIVMAAESNGRLWIATTYGRTFRSDNRMQNFAPSVLDSLLNDGLVQDMFVHGSSVWVMNDKRVLCYDTITGRISRYDAAAGVIKIEGFRHHALCGDSCGVLAGGLGGFLCLPDFAAEKDTSLCSVKLALTDVAIGGKSVFFGNDTASCTFNRIVISSEAHNIDFYLSPLTYFPCQMPPMQYRMQGAEEQWTDVNPNQPVAHYKNLPQGTFILQVRNMQSNGVWGIPYEVSAVVRLPAWYESATAYACYLIMAIVLLAAIIYIVGRRHAKKIKSEVTQAKVAIITSNHRLTDEIVKIVDAHLGDSAFSLEQLLAEMGLSKSTLYRQLKTETDMTPSDLVRSIRLKRASEMLLAKNTTISEVAYATGFSTPKYFTRCFKEEYGQTPSDYIRTHAALADVDDNN